MIRRKTDYLLLFVALAFIHQSLSAIFISFKRTHPKYDYIKARSASVYRGLFLSYSPATKNEICWDLFSSKLPATSKPATLTDQTGTIPLVTDGETSIGQPKHTLLVRRITAVGKTIVNGEDIFFNCLVENFQQDEAKSEDITPEYIVSSAFRLGLMYASFQSEEHGGQSMVAKHYIGMSPKYVDMEPAKLEERYVTMRRILRALAQTESAEYIRLIEKMDHLSKLSNWQKFILCNSIISSPVYHEEGLKFPLDRSLWDKHIVQYAAIPLSFKNSDYNEEWTAYCVPCKAIDEGNDETSPKIKDLFLVQTHDDKKSIYVFEQEEGLIYPRKYFEHVPILANTNDPITDDPLF